MDFLRNIEAYKLVEEYYITRHDRMMVTIRVVQSLVGAQDFSFKAYPFFPRDDKPATPEYQGVRATAEEALQQCLIKIDGVPLTQILFPVLLQH